jgi:type II secretory pathway component PulF
MPFVTTPGQLSRRAEMYQQLGQLTAAGLGVVQALESIRRSPPAPSYREPLQRVLDAIARGRTFTQAAADTDGWLPEFDLALLQAGETSGRLDACFRALAGHYADRARIAKQLISQLLYPVLLVHLAALVFLVILPFAREGLNFDAKFAWICIRAVLILLPCYLGAGLLVYALQGQRGERWRATIEALLHPIPMIGTARLFLALARLASALEALISAGVNVIEAWELAASASGSPALKHAVQAWKPQLAAGRTPAELVADTARFPGAFASLYQTGEVSGRLDESLRKLRDYYQEEGARKLETLANLAPKAVFLLIAVAVAYFVISFWADYFKQIDDASHF